MDSLVWHGDPTIASVNENSGDEQNMFDKSILSFWSGDGNEPTVTVTFVDPIVFHKLVIVKKNEENKAGLSSLYYSRNISTAKLPIVIITL